MISKIEKAVDQNLNEAIEVLKDLISIPSTRGNEIRVARYLSERIKNLADSIELIPITDEIMKDPDYSFKLENFHYTDSANLRVRLDGVGEGKSLAFNTHMDVVPPSEGQRDAFSPFTKDNKVFGRGANDCKGQIAILWLLLKSLKTLKLKPTGDIVIDFVIEEENGGNGTLKVVRDGLNVDAAIILEPTELQVVHLVRGAVWFTVKTEGKAGHSGSPETTVSALKEAIKAMDKIEKVREELLKVSKNKLDEIKDHPNPMPCTFGMLHSGNWPAATPNEAVLKGVFGFLPPFNREEVQKILTKSVENERAKIYFDMLNNDPSFVEKSHPLVITMLESAREAGIKSKAEFMNASCDAWRYSVQLKIPAIVFGGGSISTAHSKEENIPIEHIKKGAMALINFIYKWSGLK